MIRHVLFCFHLCRMNYAIWRKIRNLVTAILVIYIAGGAALYFLQDYILFHPVSLNRNHRYDFPEIHRDINIAINENSNLNIVQFLSTDTVTKGVVLYFHGNKKNNSWYARYPPYFTRHGYEVWMTDYPGFGKSTGRFTEENLYTWAGYVYDFARSRFLADSIIIYGKSMGTGIAANLATKRVCRRLILETPYFDFPSVVKNYLPFYPVDLIIHYKMPTYEFLQQIAEPVTIFHGTKDRVITYRSTSKLEQFLKPGDEFITITDGRHNDLFKFKTTIEKLDSLLRE